MSEHVPEAMSAELGDIVYLRLKVVRNCVTSGYGNFVEVLPNGRLQRVPPTPPDVGDWHHLITTTVNAGGNEDEHSLIYHVRTAHVMTAKEAIRIMRGAR